MPSYSEVMSPGPAGWSVVVGGGRNVAEGAELALSGRLVGDEVRDLNVSLPALNALCHKVHFADLQLTDVDVVA
jgi:hypothetical protein